MNTLTSVVAGLVMVAGLIALALFIGLLLKYWTASWDEDEEDWEGD